MLKVDELMKKYKISVVIPAYNAENTIEKCINSVLNQTFKDFEIVVVNDGSEDSTGKILNNYICFSNIKVVNQDNGGVSKARNIGINCSDGEYLFFLDSDDWIDDKLLETAYNFGVNNDIDIIACNHREINSTQFSGNTNNCKSFVAKGKREIGELFFDIYPQSACAKLFRYDMIKKNNIIFPIGMSHGEDMYFTYSALMESEKIGLVEGVYYNIQNVNFDSLSKRYIEFFEEDLVKQYELLCKTFSVFRQVLVDYNKKKMYLPYMLVSSYVDNLYKNGSPYNFAEKIRLVKKFMKNHTEWFENNILKKNKSMPEDFFKKLSYLVIMTRSSLLMNLFYLMKEKIKKKRLKKILCGNGESYE